MPAHIPAIPIHRTDRPAGKRPLFPAIAAIAACALVLGTAAQLFGPFRIPWAGDHGLRLETLAASKGIETADIRMVREILESGSHLVLDARPMEEFDKGHLPGAIPFPFATHIDSFDEMSAMLGPSQPVLVYCSGRRCDDALMLGAFLRAQGTEKIVLFPGGTGAWVEAGLPLQ